MKKFISIVLIVLLSSCASMKLKAYDYETPYQSTDKELIKRKRRAVIGMVGIGLFVVFTVHSFEQHKIN